MINAAGTIDIDSYITAKPIQPQHTQARTSKRTEILLHSLIVKNRYIVVHNTVHPSTRLGPPIK